MTSPVSKPGEKKNQNLNFSNNLRNLKCKILKALEIDTLSIKGKNSLDLDKNTGKIVLLKHCLDLNRRKLIILNFPSVLLNSQP